MPIGRPGDPTDSGSRVRGRLQPGGDLSIAAPDGLLVPEAPTSTPKDGPGNSGGLETGLPPFYQHVQQEHPGRPVETWFQDESRFGQQGTLTRVWAKRGSRPTAVRQTEYQWVWLYGAVNPQTGESMGMVATATDTEMFNVYLDMLGRTDT